MPRWVLAGILAAETGSQYLPDGTILYRDRKVGRHGEVGAFQMRPPTIRFLGGRYGLVWSAQEVHRDPRAAEMAACVYLGYLYRHHADHDWTRAIRMYCTGPNGPWRDGAASRYLQSVSAYREVE